mgnify:FL=1
MRGNSVRVVLSPSVMGAVTRGFARALGEQEVSTSKNVKDTLAIDTKLIYPGEIQSTDQQVVTFVDEFVGEQKTAANTDQNEDMHKVDASLGSFLARPVLISSFTWVDGSTIEDVLYPWELFLDNPVIKKKIDNYNFISCTLKVKVVVNASPFYYGCAGIFYEPLPSFNTAEIVETATYTGRLIPFSQRPHVYIYPASSQGGVLELPFIYHKKWLDLTSNSDVTNMGKLQVLSYTNLYNANSVSGTDCDVQIYAWAENVKLAGPTYNTALQSSDMAEDGKTSSKHIEKEYDNAGPISSVSSTVQRMANIGKSLPGPVGYGMNMLSTAAGYVTDVAKIFGYTNTPVIDDVAGFKNLPFHALASAEISSPVDRLTLDPKNILSCSTDMYGLKLDDQLSLDNFCARESYLTSFNWVASSTKDTLLWGVNVNPRMLGVDGTSNYKYQLTPMALCAYAFQWWRGTIVYRFRFICSKYHRGRVRITWEPSANLNAISDTQTSNYNYIVDLAEETDVSIAVPFLNATGFARVGSGISEYYGTTLSTPSDFYDNGQLSIRVLNQQTSPVTSADIVTLVSCYGTKMSFGGPRNISNDFSAYDLQSTDMYADGQEAKNLFEPTNDPADLNQLYMGENVTSIGQYIKRSGYHGSVNFTANDIATLNVVMSRINRYPRYPGFDDNGQFEGEGQLVPATYFPYNFVHWTPLTWFSQCFIGCRGSINWHLNVAAPVPISSVSCNRVESTTSNTRLAYNSALTTGATQSQLASFMISENDPGMSGLTLTNQNTQSALSANVPFYSGYKFRNTSKDFATLGTSIDDSDYDNITFRAMFTPETTLKSAEVRFDYYVAAGPDYSLGFFLNVPTFRQLTGIPAGNPA